MYKSQNATPNSDISSMGPDTICQGDTILLSVPPATAIKPPVTPRWMNNASSVYWLMWLTKPVPYQILLAVPLVAVPLVAVPLVAVPLKSRFPMNQEASA